MPTWAISASTSGAGFDLSGGMPVFQGGVDLSAEGFTLSYWTNVATATTTSTMMASSAPQTAISKAARAPKTT